jgi:hypothetical protein
LKPESISVADDLLLDIACRSTLVNLMGNGMAKVVKTNKKTGAVNTIIPKTVKVSKVKAVKTAAAAKPTANAVAGKPAKKSVISATKVEKKLFEKISSPLQKAMNKALDNVIKLGDTDVFPRSFEMAMLADSRPAVLELLSKTHLKFQDMLIAAPPVNDKVLAAVGYNGFRAVTQVDPIWNLYLLSLVILLASDIEAARVPTDKKVVHSYRFKISKDDPYVFDSNYGWFSFHQRCEELAKQHKFVLLTDISDFYPRIYHHRLENALKKVTNSTDAVKRIIRLLVEFSGGVSYGLPVGGPASRLLSELLLNATDRLMLAEGVKYVRFVDDFRIFASTREEAHATLVMLAQKIGESEGLSLQKSKTKIMSSEEYLSLSGAKADEGDQIDREQANYRRFMSLKLHFDPYSDSAQEDYDQLRRSLREFDIVGMLAREMRKTQIEESFIRKIIRSVKHLPPSMRAACITSLSDNLEILSPVFPLTMQVFASVAPELDATSRNHMLTAVKNLFMSKSHIVQVPVNQAYAIRVLALSLDEDAEQILHGIYQGSSSMGVKRDVITVMANRDLAWFVSDRRRNYQNLSSWERRAVLAASYILEDEGEHWRKKLTLTDFDAIVATWVAKIKVANKGRVVLPL